MNKNYKHKIKKSPFESDVGGGLFKGGSLYLPPEARGFKNKEAAKEVRNRPPKKQRWVPYVEHRPYYRNTEILAVHERLHQRYQNIYDRNWFPCFGIKTKIDIPIILPDNSEDELEIELCCERCVGLTPKQFNWLFYNKNSITLNSATKDELISFVKRNQ